MFSGLYNVDFMGKILVYLVNIFFVLVVLFSVCSQLMHIYIIRRKAHRKNFLIQCVHLIKSQKKRRKTHGKRNTI